MTDPLELIERGCYLAFRLTLLPSATPTDCLWVRNGCYGFSDQARYYHPLEAILVSEDATTGDWRMDTATKLGVTPAWIEGFVAGFAQAEAKSTQQDFIQGYLTAEELRQRRPGLFKMQDGPDAEGTKV